MTNQAGLRCDSASFWRLVATRLMLAVSAIALPSGMLAQDDPDVVELTNGNRLKGTVTELSQGALTFSIDGAGSVDIDWSNVASLKSSQDFDVELASGERLSGLIESPEAGQLEVRTPDGPKLVAMKDVVGITSIEATFLERTSGSVEAGISLLQANEEFDLTLNAEAKNRTRNYLTEASLASLLRLREDNDQTRTHFSLGSRRFMQRRWFVLGRFEFEEDKKLDLNSRILVSGAVGRTVVKSHRAELALYGGIDYNHENYRDLPGTENTAEALGTVEFDWFEFGGDSEVSLVGTTFVGLTRKRARFNIEASARHDIVDNFYASLNFFGTYDSDPPGDFDKSDLGFGLTIGRSF